ncbi:MAG: gliding motility protein GldL [Flavobacteriaceae bacterium]|jgi:gliding motility-associated protein GldL|nr:gliding motility protein GldL [Flavobacteriaceae bacterium]
MAQAKSTKKMFNMAYGLGASVVIIGALFKIAHWPYGTIILTIGMIVEAIVFAISAFEPIEEDMDWSLVFPELGKDKTGKRSSYESDDVEGILAHKLDDLLKDAKVDADLLKGFTASIQKLEGAAKEIATTHDSISATSKYSEQLTLAAIQMEALNKLYSSQVENATRQAEINNTSAANAERLREQMESLSANMESLNAVYGKMLSAMSNK